MGSDEIELEPGLGAAQGAALEASKPLESATALESPTAPAGVGGDVEIARALAAGQLQPAEARNLLIEQVLAEQLPGLAPDARARLEAELGALLDGDPSLSSLLRP